MGRKLKDSIVDEGTVSVRIIIPDKFIAKLPEIEKIRDNAFKETLSVLTT